MIDYAIFGDATISLGSTKIQWLFSVTRFRHIGNEVRDEREMQHTQEKDTYTGYSTSPFDCSPREIPTDYLD